MKIIDLSHTIHADMPVYPGTEAPSLTPCYSIACHGFTETMLHMVSHTGTHIDAPAHMLEGGKHLDDYPAEQFFGLALIIDWPPCAGPQIELEPLQQMRDKIERAEFVLFNTSHGGKWGTKAYFTDYPILTLQSADYLSGFPLKGIGVDAISFDSPQSGNKIHHILLKKELILIENLCNFPEVKGEYCLLSVLPLKYARADGSPVRAVAIEMETALPARD